MAEILALSVIVSFLLLALACIFLKGDVRAGFKTIAGELFIEAKEQRRPVRPKRREDDQGSITAEPKE